MNNRIISTLAKMAGSLLTGLFVTGIVMAEPPEEPRIVNMEALEKTIGKRGGTLKLLMAKPKDIRMMVIYSGARLVA